MPQQFVMPNSLIWFYILTKNYVFRPTTNSNLGVYSNHITSSRRNSNQLRSSISSRASVKRDPSPNVSFADDFMNKSGTSVVDDNSFRADDTLSSGNNIVDSNGIKKKNKLKSKFTNISLGKLGKNSSNEQVDPPSSRVREDLKLRISNPTFTHDNLREKNFDAFFASGEPIIYSLEKKEKQLSDSSLLAPVTPLFWARTNDTPSSFATSSSSTPCTPSSERTRKNSIVAFFSSKSTTKQPPLSPISSDKRPKSTELYRSREGSVKGDRCPIQRFWWIRNFHACLSGFLFKKVAKKFFFYIRTNRV